MQDAIPIRRIWEDGIFQSGNLFSKTFSFTDINYSIAGKEDKTTMFLDYAELLNSLDSGSSAKITIHNRRVDRKRLEESLLLPLKGDGLDKFRREYNQMLLSQAAGNGSCLVQERYLTLSAAKRNIEEARSYFSRIGSDLLARFSQLSSFGRELDAAARLQILHDFFHAGKSAPFPFDLQDHIRKGHSFKDWFCPDSMEFHKDCFQIDDCWGRVLYLQDYATYIRDAMIAELCDLDRSLKLMTTKPDEALREER